MTVLPGKDAETLLCPDADIANSIFETGAAVALIITMVLDNTVPGCQSVCNPLSQYNLGCMEVFRPW